MLVVVSLIAFFSIRIIPGDPARLVAGPEASEEVVEAIRHDLGMDQSLIKQYEQFIIKALQFDLGRSVRTNEPVFNILMRRLPPTLQLALASIALASILGLVIGVISAVLKGTWVDTVSMIIALFGISMPTFWSGLMMIWLFAVTLHWLPTGGYGSPLHFVMPTIVIGLQSTAVISRTIRTSMIEVLQEDYIRTARAKGVLERNIVLFHALRNSLIPTITVIGIQFGYLLAGSVVTETIFNWPGMGLQLITSMGQRDYPVIQGAILLFALFFVITSLLVDIAYTYIDPRIAYE